MSNINHVVIGTADLEQSRAFYDSVLQPLGMKRMFDMPERSFWGSQAPEFAVTIPLNGAPASAGNGSTVVFKAPANEAVDLFHRIGLAHGAQCEGPPGGRDVAPGLYAAFVRDPQGNKVGAAHFTLPNTD